MSKFKVKSTKFNTSLNECASTIKNNIRFIWVNTC